jgi:putative transposase
MSYNPEHHHRQSVRKPGHDYRSPGLYFITICTKGRKDYFGKIEHGKMKLSPAGYIIRRAWRTTPRIRPYVALDAFTIMPNHIHGIIIIRHKNNGTNPVGIDGNQSLQSHTYGPQSKNLFAIVRGFKSTTSKQINTLWGIERGTIWQSRFHDHVIRNTDGLDRIRWYIRNNPRMWKQDRNNK